jgi:XRE family transcriptional regulator, regulator of sulfur utilization
VSPTPLEEKALVALGRAIKEFRKEKGLTQDELARRADIHESYISVLESGRRNPTWPTVRRISHGLGISLLELVQRADELERKG